MIEEKINLNNEDDNSSKFEEPLTIKLIKKPKDRAIKKGFKIIVKTIQGKSIPIEVEGSLTISELKELISKTDDEVVQKNQQRLLFAGKELEDFRTLSDYNLYKECNIYLMTKLKGGKLVNETKSIKINYEGTQKVIPFDNPMSVLELKSKIADEFKLEIEKFQFLEDERLLKLDLKLTSDRIVACNYSISNNMFYTLNCIYQDTNEIFQLKTDNTVEHLRLKICDKFDLELDDFIIVYNGNILQDEQRMDYFNFFFNSSNEILIWSNNEGSSILKFTQLIFSGQKIEEIKNQDNLGNFFSSILPDLVDKKNKMVEFLKNHRINKDKSFEHLSDKELYSIILYTSDFFYRTLNANLREYKNIEKWKTYLNLTISSLKKLPFFFGKLYRGSAPIPNFDPTAGEEILWEGFTSCSKNKDEAVKFARKNIGGLLFEIESTTGREVSKMSKFPKEEEVLFMPFTRFQITEIIEGTPKIIKLKEIVTPRSLDIVFWVDDIPKNNLKLMSRFESMGKSVIPCLSTKEAIEYWKRYKHLYLFNNSNFKIITDMVRKEEEMESNKVFDNYEAGIALIKHLRKEHNSTHKILVFCNNVQKAQETVNKMDVINVQVSKEPKDLIKFIEEKEKKFSIELTRIDNKIIAKACCENYKDTWMGFYKINSDDKNYISYCHLTDKNDYSLSVNYPKEKASYQFRIFVNKYDLLFKSESIDLND